MKNGVVIYPETLKGEKMKLKIERASFIRASLDDARIVGEEFISSFGRKFKQVLSWEEKKEGDSGYSVSVTVLVKKKR